MCVCVCVCVCVYVCMYLSVCLLCVCMCVKICVHTHAYMDEQMDRHIVICSVGQSGILHSNSILDYVAVAVTDLAVFIHQSEACYCILDAMKIEGHQNNERLQYNCLSVLSILLSFLEGTVHQLDKITKNYCISSTVVLQTGQ